MLISLCSKCLSLGSKQKMRYRCIEASLRVLLKLLVLLLEGAVSAIQRVCAYLLYVYALILFLYFPAQYVVT